MKKTLCVVALTVSLVTSLSTFDPASAHGPIVRLGEEHFKDLRTLERPRAIAISADGAMVVADTGNHRIVEIYGDQLTVLLGTGKAGRHLDSTNPLKTQLNNPEAVLLAADGTIYVADTGNHRLLVVNDGQVKHLAGSGDPKADLVEGDPQRSDLNRPTGLATTADGRLLIADRGNHRILALKNGNLKSIAGNGTPGSRIKEDEPIGTYLRSPMGVAVHEDGTILIADTDNNRILELTLDNKIKRFAGTGVSGSVLFADHPAKSRLKLPGTPLVLPGGTVLIPDRGNDRVVAVADGKISKFAGADTHKFSAYDPLKLSLKGPNALAACEDGTIVIVEMMKDRLVMIAPDDPLQTELNLLFGKAEFAIENSVDTGTRQSRAEQRALYFDMKRQLTQLTQKPAVVVPVQHSTATAVNSAAPSGSNEGSLELTNIACLPAEGLGLLSQKPPIETTPIGRLRARLVLLELEAIEFGVARDQAKKSCVIL